MKFFTDYFFRIFGLKRKRRVARREKRKCTCCGKMITVRKSGVTFKHKCLDVEVQQVF